MGIGMNGDDIVIKLSMDIDDIQKSLGDLQKQVSRTMENVQQEFAGSAKGLDKIAEAVYDLKNDVNKNFEKMESQAHETSNSMDKTMNKGFSSIIKGAKRMASALAVAFSVREVAQFGKEIVEVAADLEAMQAAFDQVMQFKFDDGSIKNFSDEATSRLNKMRTEWDMELNTLKGDYASFVSQFKGLGLDMTKALDSSDSALTLAADAAAMYNISMQEAIEHVRSFVKGNYIGGESIQLFGSENMMKSYLEGMTAAERKAKGLTNEWKDMEEAEKQLVRLDFAQHQYELAGTTGQAARESQLYQNQLTKLKQKWTDFKAELGTPILEKVTGAFKVLSEVMENIDTEKLGESLGNAIGKIVGWFEKIDWFTLGKQIQTIWGYLKEFFDPIWETFKGWVDGLSDILVDIFDAFGADGANNINTENMDAVNVFLADVKPMFEWLADHGEEVAHAIETIAIALAGIKTAKLISFLATPVDEAFTGAIGKALAGAGIKTIGGAVATYVLPVTVSVVAFEWLRKKSKEIFPESNENSKKNIKARTTGSRDGDALHGGKNGVFRFEDGETVEDKVGNFFKGFGQAFKNGWATLPDIGKDIANFFAPVGDFFTETLPSWLEILGGWLEDFGGWIGSGLDTAWEGISGFFADVWNGLKTFGDEMKLLFEDPFAWVLSKMPNWLKDFTDFKNGYINESTLFSNTIGGIFGEIGTKITSGIVNGINSCIQSMETLLNKIIGGINSFFKAVGIDKQLNSVNFANHSKYKAGGKYKNSGGGHHLEAYAKGTNNAHGGLSLVGEAGREIVADPRLGVFMADSATLLNLSKGATVLSNKNTEKFLKATGIKAFAKGKNEDGFWSNVWSYMNDPSKILEKIMSGLGFNGGGVIGDGLRSWVSGSLKTSLLEVIKKAFEEAIPNVDGIASVSGWIPLIHKAASFFGDVVSGNELARILQQIRNESGGNQKIVQSSAVWDVNTASGNPARGLLQYIPQTFNAYKVKGFNDIYNGYHQLLAFFNNSAWRKNLPQLGERRGWSPRGRRRAANGILVDGATPLTVGEAGQEAVVPLSNARALKPFGQSVLNAIKEDAGEGAGGVYEFTIPLYVDGREIAKATATFTKQELDKMDKRNNRLNGRK